MCNTQGTAIEDELRAMILMSSLPSSWETFVTTVCNASTTVVKYSKVTSAILTEAARRKSFAKDSTDQRASSSTHSLYGLSCHITNIPRRISLVASRRLDSPCFRRVRNCCWHHFDAFFLGPVGRLHCAPTRLFRHGHEAYLPPCTTSCYRCACSLTHLCGSRP